MKTIQEAIAEKGMTVEQAQVDAGIKPSPIETSTNDAEAPKVAPVDNPDTSTASEPKAQPETVAEAGTEEESDQDILNKVLSPKKENKEDTTSPDSKVQPTKVEDDAKFNVNDIEGITDPVAKEIAMKAYKSLEKGYQEKFQDVAKLRKDLEQKLSSNEQWTPERIKALLTNEAFVQASQQYMQTENPTGSGLDDEQWSALSETEKSAIKTMQTEILQMKNDRKQMETDKKVQMYQANIEKEDNALIQKYDNYSIDKMNELRSGLIKGDVRVTSEHMYKAFYHDENVKRAYAQGREDARSGINEKKSASAVDTGSSVTPTESIKQNEGESDKAFIIRAMAERFSQRNKK